MDGKIISAVLTMSQLENNVAVYIYIIASSAWTRIGALLHVHVFFSLLYAVEAWIIKATEKVERHCTVVDMEVETVWVHLEAGR